MPEASPAPAGALASWAGVGAGSEPGRPGAPVVCAPGGTLAEPAGVRSVFRARAATACGASPLAATIAFAIGPSPRGRPSGTGGVASCAPAPSWRAGRAGGAAPACAASGAASPCSAPGATSRRAPWGCTRSGDADGLVSSSGTAPGGRPLPRARSGRRASTPADGSPSTAVLSAAGSVAGAGDSMGWPSSPTRVRLPIDEPVAAPSRRSSPATRSRLVFPSATRKTLSDRRRHFKRTARNRWRG